MTLEQMKNIDIRNINIDEVVDVNDINIDLDLPVPERFADYQRQSVNPYFIKVGKVVVKMGFSDTTATVNDCFERYLRLTALY